MRGDDGRATLIAFLKEFKQIEVLLVCEPVGALIVETEQLDAGQFVDQLREAPIKGQCMDSPGTPTCSTTCQRITCACDQVQGRAHLDPERLHLVGPGHCAAVIVGQDDNRDV